MIKAEFFSADKALVGFRIKGHSGYAESGRDIICAFVSSAAYMTANTITDVIGVKANVSDGDGEMNLMITKNNADRCSDILEGLRLHLINTEEQYPEFINVTTTEV